ncbi:MAG: mercuric transporter MerT family protein, partial [Gemmatimonadota bacterium]
CCVAPLVAVLLGVSGAGAAATFEPLRPYFAAGSVLFLGAGFGLLRREERRACEPGTPCASPEARRRTKRWLWTATAVSLVALTFPWWSGLVLS